MLGAIGLLGLWFLVTLTKGKGYNVAQIKSMLGRGKVDLEEGKDGIAKWTNKKSDIGFLIDKNSQTQIAVGRQVRTSDGNFFVSSQGFGLTYDISVAQAINFLERNGFRNITEALKCYDENYFSKEENKKALQEAIELDRKEKTNIHVKDIRQEARSKLLTLDIEWTDDFTIPLYVTYRWALQNIDSVNNKNITDRLVLAAKKENMNQGWSQEKVMSYATIIIGVLIVGAIAFYIVTMAGNNIPAPVIPSIGNGTGT